MYESARVRAYRIANRSSMSSGSSCGWSTPSSTGAISTMTPEDVLKDDSSALKTNVGQAAVQVSQALRPQKQKLECGFMCQGTKRGRACRKQLSNHVRGAVCPDCMNEKEFLQCSNGCLAYVHVGCGEEGEGPWECLACRSISDRDLHADSEVLEQKSTSAKPEGYKTFEDLTECKAFFRLQKFRTQNTFINAQKIVTGVKFSCKKCRVHFIVKHNVELSQWLVPEGHDHMEECIHKNRNPVDGLGEKMVIKFEDFSKVKGLLTYIESMGASGEFRADQMARAIQRLFGVTVNKNLLYRTAKKAQENVFGKTQSDVLALEALKQTIENDGGRLVWVTGKDIGKIDDENASKYFGLIWIAPFAHILIESYGDMLTTDGTHGFSVNNWRAIPLCVVNSLGSPIPVGMAFCTSENAPILAIMVRHIHEMCLEKGVTSPFSENVDAAAVFPPIIDGYESTSDPLAEEFICPPEWRPFLHTVLSNEADFGLMPDVNIPQGVSFVSDGAPAFAALARQFVLQHVLCKMHLSALNTVGQTDK